MYPKEALESIGIKKLIPGYKSIVAGMKFSPIITPIDPKYIQ